MEDKAKRILTFIEKSTARDERLGVPFDVFIYHLKYTMANAIWATEAEMDEAIDKYFKEHKYKVPDF